jgi:hypothetical protein
VLKRRCECVTPATGLRVHESAGARRRSRPGGALFSGEQCVLSGFACVATRAIFDLPHRFVLLAERGGRAVGGLPALRLRVDSVRAVRPRCASTGTVLQSRHFEHPFDCSDRLSICLTSVYDTANALSSVFVYHYRTIFRTICVRFFVRFPYSVCTISERSVTVRRVPFPYVPSPYGVLFPNVRKWNVRCPYGVRFPNGPLPYSRSDRPGARACA